MSSGRTAEGTQSPFPLHLGDASRPLGTCPPARPGSSLGFVDTLLRCACLVVNRRAIPQRRMAPPVVVVTEVAGEVLPERLVRRVPRAVHHLGFERVEERFHVGVVLGAAPRRTLLDA